MRFFLILFISAAISLVAKEVDEEPVKEVLFKTLTSYELPLELSLFVEEDQLPELKKVIPKNVELLDGQKIKMKGFMVPAVYDDDYKVTEFLFAPDQNSCCFGRIPKLNGFVYSKSKEGVKNLKDILIEVTGTIFTKPKYYKEEECVLIYTMKVESVKKVGFKKGKKGLPF